MLSCCLVVELTRDTWCPRPIKGPQWDFPPPGGLPTPPGNPTPYNGVGFPTPRGISRPWEFPPPTMEWDFPPPFEIPPPM